MVQPSEFEALFKLPVAERLQLVEDLWDSIARDSDPPISDEIRQELKRRQAEFDADPGSAIPWEDVKKRLRRL